MSKLNEHAKTLRSVAQSLEDRAKSIPAPTARQVIAKYAPEHLTCCRVNVPLYPLMDKDFKVREYAIRDMGQSLGHEIAKILDVQYVMPPITAYARQVDYAAYEARVYAFTPAQLETLIDNAIRETRQQ